MTLLLFLIVGIGIKKFAYKASRHLRGLLRAVRPIEEEFGK